jgi:hypothetical protein
MSETKGFAAVMRKFKIPPFHCGAAMFERVLVFRIPAEVEKSETYGESGIIKIQERIVTDTTGTPRCVLVSAGLRAMDILRANGARLGDVVWIAPDVFTRYETGFSGGRSEEFTFCSVGDIITNESLAERGAAGELEMRWDAQRKRHVFVDPETNIDFGREEPRHRADEI